MPVAAKAGAFSIKLSKSSLKISAALSFSVSFVKSMHNRLTLITNPSITMRSMVHSVSHYKKRLYKKRLVDLGLTKKHTLVYFLDLRNAFCRKLFLTQPKIDVFSSRMIWCHYF